MNGPDRSADTRLPEGFTYPPQFLRVVRLGLLDFEPWYLLQDEAMLGTQAGLAQRYPEHRFVPFARRQDNDDIACWEWPDTEAVVIVHDFASSGWERQRGYATFSDWLRQVVEDFIDFAG